MIKFILIFAFAITTQQSISQQTGQKVTAENYVLKSKHQKTAAWVLLAGGTVMAGTALIVATSHVFEDIASGRNARGEVWFYTGLGMMGASVPFFILSGKNARKATLAFSNEYVPKMSEENMVFHKIPSLKLTIPINPFTPNSVFTRCRDLLFNGIPIDGPPPIINRPFVLFI